VEEGTLFNAGRSDWSKKSETLLKKQKSKTNQVSPAPRPLGESKGSELNGPKLGGKKRLSGSDQP